jgi:hypothetical protein
MDERQMVNMRRFSAALRGGSRTPKGRHPMERNIEFGKVEDTYGRQVTVVADRSGAVRLDMGLSDLMFTPELWDDLDRRVRSAFRPELLAPDQVED